MAHPDVVFEAVGVPEFLNISFTPGLLFDAQAERWRNYRSIKLPIATLFPFGLKCEFQRGTGYGSPSLYSADLTFP